MGYFVWGSAEGEWLLGTVGERDSELVATLSLPDNRFSP